MIHSLTFLRAFACLFVCVFHLNVGFPKYGGVAIFFILSGFLISRVMADPNTRPFEFVLNRIARVAPTYLVVSILFLVLVNTGLLYVRNMDSIILGIIDNPAEVWRGFNQNVDVYQGGWRRVFSNLAFIPVSWKGSYHPFLGVGWTLNQEIVCYLLMGVAVALAAFFRRAIIKCLGVFFILLVFAANFEAYESSYFIYFCAGSVGYVLYRRYCSNGVGSREVRKLSPFSQAVWLVAFVSGYMILFSYVPSAQGALPVALVGCALWLERYISADFFVLSYLGRASYSIYLCHTILYESYRGVLGESNDYIVLKLALGVLLGCACYELIEKRFERWRKKMFTRYEATGAR